ncbi:hypothetical protein EKD04_008085 [Chloroflexales bacterium ZM16-3]|nr:hypothetical protein [Chloroflexales bacterium ZM16-3]
MSTVPPKELVRLWSQEQITVEMAVGHIMQNLAKLQDAIDAQRQMLHGALEVQRQMLAEIQGDIDSTRGQIKERRKTRMHIP